MKKKIGYGIADFKAIQNDNYYFADKTMFIPALENAGRHLMFLRPRRFGKSLWCAILEAYYDLYFQPEFDAIFKGTWIYENRTAEASSYYCLRFDFSMVQTKNIEKEFLFYTKISIDCFVEMRKLKIKFVSDNPLNMLKELFVYFQKNNLNLYIIIDEYDNFANNLFLKNKSSYRDIVSDENAFFKQFFAIIKGGTSSNNAPVKRLFITGVTPMTMYDVTSGFNIGKNISLNPEFSAMTGFTETEVKEIFNYYEIELTAECYSLIREWYNNYRFSRHSNITVYNTDMILYFIDNFLSTGRPPDDLIDINVRSDYRKLQYLIYTNHKLNGNFELLKELIGGHTIFIDNIVQDFSAFDLTKAENFKSLLFYQGLVSIKAVGIDITMQIPNETIKRIDIDYLCGALEMEQVFELNTDALTQKLKQFALTGNIEVFGFLAAEIKRNTGIRDYIHSEQCIKAMFLAYLSLTSYFVAKSEYELNKGFADIYLKPLNPYVEYVGLVEVKYFTRSTKGRRTKKPTVAAINTKVVEATAQLEQYATDAEITHWTTGKGKKLQKTVLVFYGWELLKCVAV
jgi:hypothetical protein